MLVKTIETGQELAEEFKLYGRSENFSREAVEVIFNHFYALGKSEELDVIAMCCDYTEYTHEEFAEAYDYRDGPQDIGKDSSQWIADDYDLYIVGYTADGVVVSG